MKNHRPHPSAARAPWLVLAVLLLSACAPSLPRSYVVLVPDPDGAVGQVVVSGPKGRQVLTEAGQVAAIDGSAVNIVMNHAEVDAAFGDAKAAQPVLPGHFMLYFMSGNTQLTAASEKELQNILSYLKDRPPQAMTEVVVIGHTDTVGGDADNVILSTQRATLVAERLRASGVKFTSLKQEAHGEKNLLVRTADNVDEPRNRRVQVTVR